MTRHRTFTPIANVRDVRGLTIIEVVVAVAVLSLTAVTMTHSMLVMNQNAAKARVKNIAKAMVLSRVQEVSAATYTPADPAASVPEILSLQDKKTTVSLPVAVSGLPAIPANLRWRVEAPFDDPTIRRVTCTLEYIYLGKAQRYEVVTFRSGD